MRLSESLQRNVLESSAGRLFNKFKLRGRRNVLFFEDILAEYIRECESAGHGAEMREIAQRWMNLVIQQTLPPLARKLSPSIFFNVLLKRVWANLGIMESLEFEKDGDLIKLKTKNESITRVIGKNKFSEGSYGGVVGAFFESEVEYLKCTQTRNACEYSYRLTHVPLKLKCKDKKIYDSQNSSPMKGGVSLRLALKTGMLKLTRNRVYFRGRPIVAGEPTLFHLIDDRGILIDAVTDISFNFFKSFEWKNSSPEERLVLLKNILQSMGWGIIEMEMKGDRLAVQIRNPPYGIQPEEDSWDFLTRTILGYLKVFMKGAKLKGCDCRYKCLSIDYSL